MQRFAEAVFPLPMEFLQRFADTVFPPMEFVQISRNSGFPLWKSYRDLLKQCSSLSLLCFVYVRTLTLGTGDLTLTVTPSLPVSPMPFFVTLALTL